MARTATVLGLGLGLVAWSAAAQETATPSCGLLGQTATTAFLNLAGALGRQSAPDVGVAAALLEDVSATFARIGCDTGQLAGVFDCILRESAPGTARDTARACLLAAGFSGE